MSDSVNNLFKIALASDHGGVELKNMLKEYLMSKGHTVLDLGVQCGEKSDYPDQALLVANALMKGAADRGVLLCGSGIGISIAANRLPGIRAALCHDEYTARMSRMHNDANVLVLGGRTLGTDLAKCMVDVWFDTGFEGGRHQPRIEKIDEIAEKIWKSKFAKDL